MYGESTDEFRALSLSNIMVLNEFEMNIQGVLQNVNKLDLSHLQLGKHLLIIFIFLCKLSKLAKKGFTLTGRKTPLQSLKNSGIVKTFLFYFCNFVFYDP